MKNLYICFTLLLVTAGYGQTEEQREWVRSLYDMQEFGRQKDLLVQEDKKASENLAREAKLRGWPMTVEMSPGKFKQLAGITHDGQPVYYIDLNAEAAVETRTNYLHTGGALGLNLDGQDMTIHVWEVTSPLFTHQELGGAVAGGDALATTGPHSTAVLGTLIATGVDPDAEGMAPEAEAVIFTAQSDEFEVSTNLEDLLISNHSYGSDTFSPFIYGAYNSKARNWDSKLRLGQHYLMVAAAGNGSTNPDAMYPSYDELGYFACSKNNLVVANADDIVLDSDGNFVSATMSYQSSRGPTDDLRIKPDICGSGASTYTSVSTSTSSYSTFNGTSFATPNVSGSLLLLQQYFNELYPGEYMRAATLKGLALHTADDMTGEYFLVGPDARSGWGLLNAKRAAETLRDNGHYSIVEERRIEVIDQNDTYSFTVYSDGVHPLQASISWTDTAGPLQDSDSINDPTPRLVYDVDMRITQGTDTFYPWGLTSAVSNSNTQDNYRDPFERIDIPNAEGQYTISISRKGGFPYNGLDYSLIVTGITLCTAEDEDIVVTTTFGTGDDIHEHAQETVTATNTINTGADVHYRGGEYVALNPGFLADEGAIFLADIGGCSGIYEPDFDGGGAPRRPMPQDGTLAESLKALTLYPNPADTSVDIKLHNGSFTKVLLYSIDGKQVLSQYATGTEHRFDISSLEGGIYIIVAETASGEKYNEKLIID